MRRAGALRRRYGHGRGQGTGALYGLPEPQRHSYRELLNSMWNNQGQTKSMWRHWMTQHGLHKAVTERVLTLAERRGHVDVHAGRYYLTKRGMDFVHPSLREARA